MLSRRVLPITINHVAPELTVEPQDVRKYRLICRMTPLLVTSIKFPYILDLGPVLYEIQEHLNYLLPSLIMFRSEIPCTCTHTGE